MRLALLALALAAPAFARFEYVPETYRDIFAEEVEAAGMEQYAPLIAAQIKHESGWRPGVCSSMGACGLSQFMPKTWGDMPRLAGADWGDCADKGPTDPRCAIRAQLVYMRELVRYVYASKGVTRPLSHLDAFQLALASYNAGQGNILKERRDCYKERSCRSGVWLDNVEEHCLRASRYCPETRHYVGRITNTALGFYLAG